MTLNIEQYMLIRLAEELNEAAEMCMKCLRFGLNERYKDGPTNITRLIEELHDVVVALEYLDDHSAHMRDAVREYDKIYGDKQAEKEEKMNKYIEYSRSIGVL